MEIVLHNVRVKKLARAGIIPRIQILIHLIYYIPVKITGIAERAQRKAEALRYSLVHHTLLVATISEVYGPR